MTTSHDLFLAPRDELQRCRKDISRTMGLTQFSKTGDVIFEIAIYIFFKGNDFLLKMQKQVL